MRLLPVLFYCAFMIPILSGCLTVREDAELISASGCKTLSTSFAGGSGTVSDPYLICSATQLKNVASDLTLSYKLTANISLSGVTFTPIGTNDSTGFSGTFDGGGFTISGWRYLNSSETFAVGFFRKLSSTGVIKNLTLSSAVVTGGDVVGGFAGVSEGTISSVTLRSSTVIGNVKVSGIIGESSGNAVIDSSTVVASSITGLALGAQMQNPGVNKGVGGFAGVWTSTGAVTSARVVGSVIKFTANGFHVNQQYSSATGGVLGFMSAGSVSQSAVSSNTTVEGFFNVGGMVGYAMGSITDSSAQQVTVNGYSVIGGIAGISTSNILRSSATGNVTGYIFDFASDPQIAGGLAGNLNGTASQSFFSGRITSSGVVGGLIGGALGATVENCYAMGELLLNSGATGNVSVAISQKTNGSLSNSYVFFNQNFSGRGYVVESLIGTQNISNFHYLQSGLTQSISGASPEVSDTDMADPLTFGGYDSTLWKMPSAYPNRFDTSTVLSPVLAWECGKNGITCL